MARAPFYIGNCCLYDDRTDKDDSGNPINTYYMVDDLGEPIDVHWAGLEHYWYGADCEEVAIELEGH